MGKIIILIDKSRSTRMDHRDTVILFILSSIDDTGICHCAWHLVLVYLFSCYAQFSSSACPTALCVYIRGSYVPLPNRGCVWLWDSIASLRVPLFRSRNASYSFSVNSHGGKVYSGSMYS